MKRAAHTFAYVVPRLSFSTVAAFLLRVPNSSCQMMFADDVVLFAREKYLLQLALKQWRPSRKEEYKCQEYLNRTPLGSVQMQGHIIQVSGKILQSGGNVNAEVNKPFNKIAIQATA